MNTDENGKYEYETILPGFYPNGGTFRPRHIHYKVSHENGAPLTTQLYFDCDPYIPVDPFVKQSLIIPLTKEGDTLRGVFDIVLA